MEEKKTKIKKDLFRGARTLKSNSQNRGITLIALVITIIILLILAGITISQLGNSGLFDKSKTAKEKYQNAQDDENDKIAKYSNEIDSYVDGNRDTVTIDKSDYEDLLNSIRGMGDYQIVSFENKNVIYNQSNILESITLQPGKYVLVGFARYEGKLRYDISIADANISASDTIGWTNMNISNIVNIETTKTYDFRLWPTKIDNSENTSINIKSGFIKAIKISN